MLKSGNLKILYIFTRKCSVLIKNVGHVSFLHKTFQSSSADGNFQVFKNSETKSNHAKISRRPRKIMHPTVESDKVGTAHRGLFSTSFHKIFSEIFEDERHNLAPAIQLDLTLSLFEAAMGCTKDLTFGAFVPCKICNGKGHPSEGNKKDCPTCKGVGKVAIPPFTSKCHFCKGMGYVMKDSCNSCRGQGVMDSIKNLKVKIPQGIENGDTIFISEAGNIGPHWHQPGDLFIKLKISENTVFSRHGADLHMDTSITLTQAVLGGRVEIPGLSGQISLKIPLGVQHGQVVILRGRGLPHPGCFMDHGDLYVRFRVNLPRSLNEGQRQIFEEFAREEISQENEEL